MANLYELERHRLKLYGEMLKNDLTQRKKIEQADRQEQLRRDSIELERHILNTRKFEATRRIEDQEINQAIQHDNMTMSILKQYSPIPKTYAEEGTSFVSSIHEMDSKRLMRLKADLEQQANDHQTQHGHRKALEEQIRQIDRIEGERHTNRIKEWQMDSVKNYEEIKRKHQQNMHLYQQHKRLMEANQQHREQIQAFTNGEKGMLDRYNRNEYLQRKSQLMENQDEIKKQIDEFQRRKSMEISQYKRNKGDLEHSMLGSVYLKAPRYEPKAYNNELKTQMRQDSLKRNEERSSQKEKIEINSIFGGVHGREREKMIRIIDRGIGLDAYQAAKNRSNSQYIQPRKPEIQYQASSTNPEKKSIPKRQMTPRAVSRSRKNEQRMDTSQPQLENTNINQSNLANSISNNQLQQSASAASQSKKPYLSYDVIAGKPRYYRAD